MKLSKFALAAAIAWGIYCGNAQAQDSRVPTAVRPTAFTNSYYYQGEGGASPSDRPPPAPMAEVPPMAEVAPAAPMEAAAEEECTPWGLMTMLEGTCIGDRLNCRGIRIYGNMAQSMTFNFDSPPDRWNGPVTWTDRSNEYQMNQLWVGAEKATDASEKNWDLGGRVDVMWGTNHRFNTAWGLEDNWNNGNAFYGLAMPNMYAEVAHCDWKVKIGHFASPVGYFGIDTTQNIFNTLPYTYQYGEPFTHTGVLATKTVSEKLTLGGGFTRGWDNFAGDPTNSGASPNLGVIGTATYTAENGGSIAYVNMWSNEVNQLGAGNFSGRYLQTLVLSRPLTETVTYVAQSDFGTQEAALASGRSAQWYGLNHYLLNKRSDCVTWAANFEWFRDEDGYRVGGFLPSLGGGSTVRGLPLARYGYQGNFFQVTVGPKWSPYKNLFVRPNLRFDWFDGTSPAANLRPYDAGNSNRQVIFGTDLVWTF
ncbi:MAG: outer membrane beta-barrel protein [Planctomycetaceae bacterium]